MAYSVMGSPATVESENFTVRRMTVYVTSAELLAVEQARLQLRSELSRSVDRGRFVRAALAVALADLEARGTESDVARRLSES